MKKSEINQAMMQVVHEVCASKNFYPLPKAMLNEVVIPTISQELLSCSHKESTMNWLETAYDSDWMQAFLTGIMDDSGYEFPGILSRDNGLAHLNYEQHWMITTNPADTVWISGTGPMKIRRRITYRHLWYYLCHRKIDISKGRIIPLCGNDLCVNPAHCAHVATKKKGLYDFLMNSGYGQYDDKWEEVRLRAQRYMEAGHLDVEELEKILLTVFREGKALQVYDTLGRQNGKILPQVEVIVSELLQEHLVEVSDRSLPKHQRSIPNKRLKAIIQELDISSKDKTAVYAYLRKRYKERENVSRKNANGKWTVYPSTMGIIERKDYDA